MTQLHPWLGERLPQVTEICRKYKVRRLYAFGSVVDGRFRPGESDIDMLVELRRRPEEEKNKTLVALWFDLQGLLECEVDLLTSKGVRGKYFKKYLELYKILIFDDEQEVGIM